MREVPLDFLERLLATIIPDEWNTLLNQFSERLASSLEI